MAGPEHCTEYRNLHDQDRGRSEQPVQICDQNVKQKAVQAGTGRLTVRLARVLAGPDVEGVRTSAGCRGMASFAGYKTALAHTPEADLRGGMTAAVAPQFPRRADA